MSEQTNYVFRDLVISWKGEEVKFTPSMNLLRSIEREDISFIDISVKTTNGRAPVFDIAHVVSRFLASAGVKASSVEVLGEMTHGNEKIMQNFISVVLTAASPILNNGKNLDAQTGSQSKARAKQKADE
jgi:hypothetical protein